MTDGEKFALKRRLKERYAWDKRRVYEIAEEEINSMKKTPTIDEILDKISAEIKGMEYHMIDCEVLVSQEEVLDILDNIGKGDKE